MISITAALWGILAIVLKYALQRFSGNTIIWFRFTFSFVFLSGYYLIHRPQFFEILIKPPILGILAGLALAGNYLGFTSGVALTSPSNAQILIQISPLLVAVVGVAYFKERLTLLQKSGFGIAASGFVLFYWDQLHHLMISSQQYTRGNLWIIFGAITWAGFAVCQKLLVRIWTPQQTNLLIYLVAALVFFPLAVFHEFQGLVLSDWLTLIFLGANTLIAYGTLGEALKLLPANQVSAIIVLNPLITLIVVGVLSVRQLPWLSSESTTMIGYAGALVLLAGVGLVVKKE
ncbi:MAG: DMT family transporter [Deltaproteobacteria bacterium]|nr:DMT family transporter [Deltaproteobacteria bacterium]